MIVLGRVLTPDSRITISHGGSRVLIRNVSRIDQTTYLCRAQNVAGTRDAGADLIIKERGTVVNSTFLLYMTLSDITNMMMPMSSTLLQVLRLSL